MNTPLEEALDYGEERGWGLAEIVPDDIDADKRWMIRVNAGGQDELLVEVGWGTAGLFCNVRAFHEDELIELNIFEMNGTVTITGPPRD